LPLGTRTCDTSSFASRGRQPPSKRRRVRGASTAVPASGTTHADLAGQPGSNTVASIMWVNCERFKKAVISHIL
jgi:hypothetical protein